MLYEMVNTAERPEGALALVLLQELVTGSAMTQGPVDARVFDRVQKCLGLRCEMWVGVCLEQRWGHVGYA